MRISPAQPGAVGLFAVLSLLGCSDPVVPGSSRASGSVAISKDDALVYAVDTDNGQLSVVNAKSHALVATVKVGERPARVVVAPDETIYVANRGSRSVSVVRKGEWTVSKELATDVDPLGLALSPDGKTLLVACATASDSSDDGTLAAYDTVSLQRSWTVQLPDESRSVAWLDARGGQAIVGLYRTGEVALIDLSTHQIIQGQAGLYPGLNASANGQATFHPRAMSDVVLTPDGKRAFGLGQLATEGIIPPPPPVPAGGSTVPNPYYQGKGPGFAGSVSTAAVFTFDTGAQLTPAVDDLWNQGIGDIDHPLGPQTDHPQTSFANSGFPDDPLVQGAVAAAVDPKGDWLYVLSRESSNVVAVPTKSRLAHDVLNPDGTTRFSQLASVYAKGDVGPGADGLAVASDNKSLWVYSQFDHRLVELRPDDSRGHMLELVEKAHTDTAPELLDPALAAGRRLFYDANDRRISGRGAAIACSSCHLEGRDDGHVWRFPDGPRQTPSLAGRGLLDTAPYHWSGEFATLGDFLDHTLTVRMGGSGLDAASAANLDNFIASLPAPENPNVSAQLTDAQLRGAALFAQAGCGSCHTGQWLTNDALANVGTLVAGDTVTQGLNVPSLKGLARTAPYLHDGSALTLRERLENNPGDRHGATSTLTSAQLDDLVAYLKSL